MAYSFSTRPAATFQYLAAAGNNKNLTVSNISGQVTDANIITKGLQGMVWIGLNEDEWEAAEGIRTIKQDVQEE